METLSQNKLLHLNRAIGDIYSARDMTAFCQVLFTVVPRLISSEYCSCSEVSLNPTCFSKIVISSEGHNDVASKHSQFLNANLHQHPLLPQFESACGNVFKTTDFVSINQFKNTDIYNDYYRIMDVETQVGLSFQLAQGVVLVMALNRKNIDFSERDRLVLTQLKPHLTGSLQIITELGQLKIELDLLQRGEQAQRHGVLRCNANGEVVAISALACEMIARHFAVTVAAGELLPDVLAQWIRMRNYAVGAIRPLELAPFVIESNNRRLTIKLLSDVDNGGYLLTCTEYDSAEHLRRLQKYAMSSREMEVVLWLANGKTNQEIASILNISKRTVDKHMENIFTKLGVETRTAAMAVVRNAV
jgi:DNA-binding CsgD family transcriptional regulator